MKPRTLSLDTPIFDLAEEVLHTRALLAAHPFLATQAAEFEPLYGGWQELMQQEMALLRQRLDTEARAIIVDDAFDFLCVAISATLLAESGGNRKAPAYLRYFGAAPPSKLKRPVLGDQLETMRTWVPSLQEANQSEALRGYGDKLATAVADADAAVTAMSEAAGRRADHEIGPRKAYIDRLNAARLSLYGQLAKIPLDQPALNLEPNFAYRFFLRGRNRRNPTIADVEQTIFRLRERLVKQEALLAEMLEAEEAARQIADNAELRAAEEAMAAAERAQAEAEARLEEIRSRLAPT